MRFLSRLLFPCLLLWALLSCGPVRGAPADADAGKPAQAATARLTVGTRTVFVFRAALAGYSAQERLDGARKRLEKALAAGGAQHAETRDIAEGTQVLLDGRLLFLVTPGDVNPLAGDSTGEIAVDAAAQLSRALLERRELGSPRYLLTAIGLCVMATIGYAFVLRTLSLLRRRVRAFAQRSLGRRLARVSFRNVALLDPDHYIRFLHQVAGLLVWAARLFATFLWLSFLLAQIPAFRSWGERLRDYMIATAFELAGKAAGALPGLFVVVVIAALARMAMLTAGSVLSRVENGELQLSWLDRDTALPTRRLVNVGIVLFTLAMAYPYLPGAHTAAFQGVTVLAGLMVSIGGSSLVAQGASGLILMYTRALRVGEYVQIGEAEGIVIELGMFETKLRTGLGAEISLPNALVLGNTTKNFSRTDAIGKAAGGADSTIETAVTVGYATPWRLVHAMLHEAAGKTEGVVADPAPFIAQAALSDFYIEYRLVAHVRAPSARERLEALSRLHQHIVDVFNLNGVAMTSPHFMQEPLDSHVVPPAAWSGHPQCGQCGNPPHPVQST